MTVIGYATFQREMFAWAEQSYTRFRYFLPLDGGWEYWVQAEVAAFIVNANSSYEIWREPGGLYANNQRPDWGLNLQTGGYERIAVELKCQRGTDLHGSIFFNDIVSDANKLNEGNLPIGVQRCLVGLYFSPQAQKKILTRYKFTMQNHKLYNQEVGVFVFYGGRDF